MTMLKTQTQTKTAGWMRDLRRRFIGETVGDLPDGDDRHVVGRGGGDNRGAGGAVAGGGGLDSRGQPRHIRDGEHIGSASQPGGDAGVGYIQAAMSSITGSFRCTGQRS